ncbi:hypothetical protein [Streptomyces caatingaensis]|uniref:hypothetical protein n=1 Tax=Streptomyces caatingaensis TaxID=1678637 RepID=UPI003BB1F785
MTSIRCHPPSRCTSGPHLSVLPHASAFVAHGGMASVMESLYSGCPALVVPLTADARRPADVSPTWDWVGRRVRKTSPHRHSGRPCWSSWRTRRPPGGPGKCGSTASRRAAPSGRRMNAKRA